MPFDRELAVGIGAKLEKRGCAGVEGAVDELGGLGVKLAGIQDIAERLR